jgi:exonuclease SbcC
MVSLSLALGLSEVVQQQSGGIKIDAMFIDEGFGTLDSEQSLQQAIKVLDSLATNDRVVGIISHVNELKEHITNRLIVEKSPSGSTITY